MLSSSLSLSRRLEAAEGHACLGFAEAHRLAFPDAGSTWVKVAGTWAVFQGVHSPVTQTFGLGLFEPATVASLTEIERFFTGRGAPVVHEVSPFAGTEVMGLLCARGYRPVEISNVLCRRVEGSYAGERDDGLKVRVAGPEEHALWNEVSARGWAHDHPELETFLREFGALSSAREGSVAFLGEADGIASAAGMLFLHEGVALFGGASTVPEMRRRGLQGALLRERMRYASHAGCDLAMMVAEAGSESQRNAEREGFQVAYTRLKWTLAG